MNNLEESYEAYQQQRAQDKYDGKAGKLILLKEFRECADYLAEVLKKAAFDSEDLEDMVRVAISRHGDIGAAPVESSESQAVFSVGG
jgi:hypothetical protein